MSYFNDSTEENPKYPCGVCSKIIAMNHKAIRCNLCNYKIQEKDFEKNKTEAIMFCLKSTEEILPFQRLTNQQFHVRELRVLTKILKV